MLLDEYANFLDRQGHHVIQSNGYYWYDAQPKFYFYFPYHRTICPSQDEINNLLWRSPALGIRYLALPHDFGKFSYNIVCEDKSYGLESVDPNFARRQTRRGLENFQIRQISISEAHARGQQIFIDTLRRQGRNPEYWNKNRWDNYFSAAKGTNGIDVWGAFYQEDLAALLVGYHMEECYTILHQASSTHYLPKFCNNALVFYVTKTKINSDQIRMVFYGPQSLDAPETLDKFKFRMGFVKRPIKQRIVFHPFVKPFINRSSHSIVRRISTRYPKSDFWRKSEGMIRFYQESN